jgi:hypothetical protein
MIGRDQLHVVSVILRHPSQPMESKQYLKQIQQQQQHQLSATASALLAVSDIDLRVPYYCEENVWRLVYRHTCAREQNVMNACGSDHHDSTTSMMSTTPTRLQDIIWYVIFISNHHHSVLMRHQRAAAAATSSRHEENVISNSNNNNDNNDTNLDRCNLDDDDSTIVCWDYHVIAVAHCYRRPANDQTQVHHHHLQQQQQQQDVQYNSTDRTTTTTSSQHNVLLVYDLDSCLPYPCPLSLYLSKSFPLHVTPQYQPMFRVVSGINYLSHFASDRRHMYNEMTHQYNAPPPSYAYIQPFSSSSLCSSSTATTTTTSATTTRPLSTSAPKTLIHNLTSHYLDFSSQQQQSHAELMSENEEEVAQTIVCNAYGAIVSLSQLQMLDFFDMVSSLLFV